MRKILIRTCLGVVVPGGPCDLEIKIETAEVSTETTFGIASKVAILPARFDASTSLNDTAFGVVRE